MKTVVFLLYCFLSTVYAACPAGSIQFQNFCYVFEANALSLPSAELACNGMNGNLASVHDGFTNAVITGKPIL
jgi:hypothetical protein